MQQDKFKEHTRGFEQLNAIKANDEKVLQHFYQANYPKIEKYVLSNQGSEEQAKDIFQDAFIVVWRNIQLDKFSPENETSLSGYLFQVGKNKWLDQLRSGHHRKVVPIDLVNLEFKQEEILSGEEQEYINTVKHYFKNLGDTCREVLIKFYYHNAPLKQIASDFNWTEPTTRNNKYRCLQQLKELIKNK
jgi:RNA polymerase sigma factor (sigma-70 family)